MSALNPLTSPHVPTIKRVLDRIDDTIAADLGGFPHFADPSSGVWTTTPVGDWTGGFWVGELWLAGAHSGHDEYFREASEWAQKLIPRAQSKTIFRGFLFYYGAALGSILASDSRARELALSGARALAADYNERVGLIPLGEEAEEAHTVGAGETNVDGVGASALLLWAARQTGQALLRDIAINHALRHIEFCVRDDDSVCQSASFDEQTGRLLRRYTHKGYTDDSTWTRAQAWAMLGFTLATEWSEGDPRFLSAAERVSDWWMAHVPPDYVAFWDFDVPIAPAPERDTSGTAIAAASLLKLSGLTGSSVKAQQYRSFAENTVAALVSRYLTPTSEDDRRARGSLTAGCYNRRLGLATNNELIWGDYYLFESLCVLAGTFPATSL
jgi:unsaturated chondroitin disaccharide hydrolase